MHPGENARYIISAASVKTLDSNFSPPRLTRTRRSAAAAVFPASGAPAGAGEKRRRRHTAAHHPSSPFLALSLPPSPTTHEVRENGGSGWHGGAAANPFTGASVHPYGAPADPARRRICSSGLLLKVALQAALEMEGR
jgi:hypothetical protein